MVVVVVVVVDELTTEEESLPTISAEGKNIPIYEYQIYLMCSMSTMARG